MTKKHLPMSKRFRIITLGCKVNQYESAFFREALKREGWREARKGEQAHAAVVNTCIVTQRAAHQSRQAIRKVIRENPGARVAAVGCYGQLFAEELAHIEGLSVIGGNRIKGRLPQLLLNGAGSRGQEVFVQDFEPEMTFEPLRISRFLDRARACLKIQDGCESYCTYCIVPFTRGPQRSLPPREVLSMLHALAQEGYREVVLTGIHLGQYGVDLPEKTDLKGLLRAIGKEGFPVRIRLSSLEPDEIGAELIEMIGSEPWLCRHVHISLQSGDDRVLRRMNRPYKARDFTSVVEGVHGQFPLVAIGADIICGFPGEDRAAYRNTQSLIRDLPVSYLHVFPFSPRPKTAAAAFKEQVEPAMIKERSLEMRDLGQEKRARFYRTCLGNTFSVLPEKRHPGEKEMMKGTSDNYLPVLFPLSRGVEGPFVSVVTEQVAGNNVLGRVLEA